MKAVAKCPICGKTIYTTCKACIEAGTDTHICKGDKNEASLVKGIKWKITPENEKELLEIEEIKYGK
jgi:hypothetical protein